MGILMLTKSALVVMAGFLLAVIIGRFLIPILNTLKAKQNISIYTLKQHMDKQGTPTMGGLIFIISTIILTLVLLITKKINFNGDIKIVLITFISFSFIGLLDDILSLLKQKNEGLSAFAKFTLQVIVSIFIFYLYLENGGTTNFYVSALNINIPLYWLYGPFIFLILVGSSNAVNLTDGLDGLAGTLSVVAFVAFSLISIVVGKFELALFIMILSGSIIGFLVYNVHPAKVFMGDCGSLSIGAVMGVTAILVHKEITLLVVAGVFVIETLSVIIQTISMIIFKKKLFLMTPLHHHFERRGWKERDIVRLFVIIGFILSMAGIYYGVWL